MIKLLHISDVHLEAKLSFLGDRAGEYRQQIIKSFESACLKAIDLKVDALLVTGDLFDTAFPSKTVVDIVQSSLMRLANQGIYSVLIPGNHDYLQPGCVYLDDRFAKADEKIIIFNDSEKKEITIESLKMVLHALPNTMQKSKTSPIPALERNNDGYTHVALAHGSFEVKGKEADNYPISSTEIAESGYDYIALGDWHVHLDVSQEGVSAVYAGSLEPLAIDQANSGKANLVQIDNGNTTIEVIHVGRFAVCDIEIDIKESENLLQLIDLRIKRFLEENKKGPKDLIVKISLVGDRSLEQDLDIENLEEYFQDKVFFAKIQDKTQLGLSGEMLAKYSDQTVMGRYMALIKSRRDLDEQTKQKAIEKGARLLAD